MHDESAPRAPAKARIHSVSRARRYGLVPLFAIALAACGRYEPEDNQAEIKAEAQSTPERAPERAPAPRPAPPARSPAAAGEGWNEGQIAWQRYEAGVAQAKAQNKPVCLVFYTTWCPHCRNFSHVFDDPKVVEAARNFVMIRVNADEEGELNQRFNLDGTYIPRTFFLSPDGTVNKDIHVPRPQFAYFYDEHNPAALLAGMAAARKPAP